MKRIGIFGGGQLAKMTAQAASTLGIETVIFANSDDEPALKVTPHHLIGSWADDNLLQQFAQSVDVVTPETASVPIASLQKVESLGTLVYAASETIEQAQDRFIQKRRMRQAGIDVLRFKKVMVGSDILEASTEFGFPLMLKTRTHNINGIGNRLIRRAHDIEPALKQFDGYDLMVEEIVNFVRELAVIVARGHDGSIRAYPVVETIRKNNICHIVRCPAAIDESVARLANDMAIQAVEAIDGVGVFGIEMLEIADNQILFNAITPHPHNSGHYTIEGTITSQFENHVRTILGLPLGDVAQIAPATAMINILGERDGEPSPNALAEVLSVGGIHVHLYGKSRVRPGRKMGHITVLGYNTDGAEKVARLALSKLNL